jgi:hypothetical protein
LLYFRNSHRSSGIRQRTVPGRSGPRRRCTLLAVQHRACAAAAAQRHNVMRHQAVTIHDIRDRVLAFDLIDILRLAGPDAEASSWRCRNVECTGDLAEELHRASDAESALTGVEMLRLAVGVVQVIDGEFEAYRPDEHRPWLVVRAIDSSEYAVVTQDERLLARIRERFRDVRDSPDDATDVA